MPKWQQHHVWRVGELYVDERRDADLNRTVRVAPFTEPTFPDRDLMAPLHDVQLATAKPDLLTPDRLRGRPERVRQAGALPAELGAAAGN